MIRSSSNRGRSTKTTAEKSNSRRNLEHEIAAERVERRFEYTCVYYLCSGGDMS